MKNRQIKRLKPETKTTSYLLKSRVLFVVFNMLIYMYYCYVQVNDNKIFHELDKMLHIKHIKQFMGLNGNLRSDAILFVSKGSEYGIFDHKLQNKEIGAFKPNLSNYLILKKDLKYEEGCVNFILSDKFKLDDKYKCYRIDLKWIIFANRGIINDLIKIKSFVEKHKLAPLKYKEIIYDLEKTNNYTLETFVSKDICKAIKTIYKSPNETMSDVQNMFDSIKYLFNTREEYSEKAVDLILQYLVRKKILKHQIDLEEYPDIVQLITPFDFVFRTHSYWRSVELKHFGFDLRNIKNSELSHLFNLNIVSDYCKSGGVYIVNDFITYGQ